MVHYIMSPNTRICYWHDINLCDQIKVFIEINLLMSKLSLLNRDYRQLNIPSLIRRLIILEILERNSNIVGVLKCQVIYQFNEPLRCKIKLKHLRFLS